MNQEPNPCVVCGKPGDDAGCTDGRSIGAGYSSKHDGITYVKTVEDPLPIGEMCDECIDQFIISHKMVHAWSLGGQHRGLPAAAYREVFLMGQDQAEKMFAKLNAALQSGGREAALCAFLEDAVSVRDPNPFTAGLISGILATFDVNVNGVADLYAEAIAGEEEAMLDLINSMSDEEC